MRPRSIAALVVVLGAPFALGLLLIYLGAGIGAGTDPDGTADYVGAFLVLSGIALIVVTVLALAFWLVVSRRRG